MFGKLIEIADEYTQISMTFHKAANQCSNINTEADIPGQAEDMDVESDISSSEDSLEKESPKSIEEEM